jgi:hypothetical protein
MVLENYSQPQLTPGSGLRDPPRHGDDRPSHGAPLPRLHRFMTPFLLLAQLVASTLLSHPTHWPSPGWTTPPEAGDPAGESPAPPEADRAAILAMAGEFRVTFAFDETVVLAEGYNRTEPHRSGAREIVLLVEDAGTRIVLQHILVSPSGHVTKHWRQDWHFEARERLEFVDDQRWELRPVPEERVAGGWTQCVYEVSDAPRYCGTGHWNHRYGNATWTSDRSWRPLPRREYTRRSDYNALNAENRHTVTAEGWTHEQDNTKTLRRADGTSTTLVREFGFNDYRRTDALDFSPALDYWRATGSLWAEVRDAWDRKLAGGGVELLMEVDGMPLIVALFELAERVRSGHAWTPDELAAPFARYVRPLQLDPSAAVAGGGASPE